MPSILPDDLPEERHLPFIFTYGRLQADDFKLSLGENLVPTI